MTPADPESPRPTKDMSGRVVRGSFGRGSKSQREALFLETAHGRYVLRRKSGPVFGDVELQRYVGQRVRCDGFIVGTTLLAERIQVIE